MNTKKSICKRLRGFTLIELLWSVGAVSIFSTVAIVAMNRQTTTAEQLKLQQQIKSLNSSLQAYEISGGSLDGIASPQDAIAKLKTRVNSEQQEQAAGLTGNLVDPRLMVVGISAPEAQTNTGRAVWNSNAKRFAYATSGTNAAKQFVIAESAAVNAVVTEERTLTTKFAAVDNWVWDYEDQDGSGSSGLGDDTSSTLADVGDVPTISDPNVPTTTNQLLPPSFSVPSGIWEYQDFDLTIELTNNNPSEVSAVYYSLNNGTWELYTGPLTVGPDTKVDAYAQSLDPLAYADSAEETEAYDMVPQMFSGTALGSFTGATGGYNMNISYSEDGTVARFEWGTGVYGTPPSWLEFSGLTFSTTGTEIFMLGTLDYYNGTIWSSTGADTVDLDLEITFTVPDTEQAFVFDLSLENTTNHGVDADADADFVRIDTPQSDFQTTLNGIQYALDLQFGYDGTNGFSTVDEFHVHEGASATANVYGVFVIVDEETP